MVARIASLGSTRGAWSLAVVLAATAAGPLPSPASAQEGPTRTPPESPYLTLEDYLDWERVADPRISPDGERVIYTRSAIDKLEDSWESAIWTVRADGSRNRFLVDGSSPRWSPDGRRIAFLDRDDAGNTQIFVRWMDDEGPPTQITRVTERPGDIAWSPDGESLAFTMRVPPERSASEHWKIHLPRPEGADWTAEPRIVERVVYRQDRVGWLDEGFEHVFVVDAEGGTPRRVTAGDHDHENPVWMPDGTRILFSGLLADDWEYRWAESEVYSVDVSTGAVTQLTTRKGPDSRPLPSPDGRLVAYVGYDTTGLDYIESALYVMEADGSNPRPLTAGMDRSPGTFRWAPDGRGLYVGVRSEGHENVLHVDLEGRFRRVTEGAHMLDLADVSPGGLAVGTLEAGHQPEDVVVFRLSEPHALRRLTHVNDDVLAGKRLGEVEEIRYPSFDGTPIQGWIIRPPDFDPSRRYPMMLVIHGGPHSMYDVGFNFSWQEHAANGYVILYTNPRGSSGYGTEFGNAIQYAYPGDDFHDLMAGVDTVLGRGYVDPDNLFVYGCSGGGVLTAWTVGHTDRFRAASANCPVIDWLSFPGQVDGNYLRWYADFEHFPWEDPSEHLRRSPLMYAGNVTTPVLLITGVRDLRTPISQTEEFYQALRAQGKPAAMIRMNEEWHGTSSKPSNFLRTQLYLRRWFERWGDHDDAPPVTQESGSGG